MGYIYVSEKYDKFINGKWAKSWCDKEPLVGETKRICHKSLSGGRWDRMQHRCNPKHTFQIKHPTYIGASVAFRDYQSFVEWSRSEVGYDLCDDNGRSWCLDKDILAEEVKEYSEDTCIFIPNKVNCFLTSSDATRGQLPLGVSFNSHKGCLESWCSHYGSNKYLGAFKDSMLAHREWQKAKIILGLQLAEEFSFHKKLKEGLIKKISKIESDFNQYRETLKV